MVKASCLGTFRQYWDKVDDRGSKDKRESLYRKMEHAHTISIIHAANYKKSKKLGTGVCKLLENTVKKNNFHLCVIGASDALFDELFKEAIGRPRSKLSKTGSQSPSDCNAEGFKFPDTIMRLMDNVVVPADREQKYLGSSKEAEFVRRLILLAAKNDTPVLIVGATGTGKEVVARQIHDCSERGRKIGPHAGTEPDAVPKPNGKFVPVNCGAITGTLFELELFGYVKGAFTGADNDKTGLWEEADKGTLFLDEIGELPFDMQAKILRSLQEKKIRPVGSEKEIPVDARIIAATNRDLFSMVESETFREYLYYRLRDFYIPTPSLKDHPDDIPLMAQTFWRKNITRGEKKPLPVEITNELREYRWPGNARELKAVLNQLSTLFPANADLGKAHLFAIFELQGLLSGQKAGSRTRQRQEHSCSKSECRRHLRRVEDAIRATEVATVPLAKHGETDYKAISKVSGSIAYRLDELDMLCRYPLRFHDESAFVRVNTLKSKLFYLNTLLVSGEVEKALSNWEESVRGEFAATLSAVRGEIEVIRLEKRL